MRTTAMESSPPDDYVIEIEQAFVRQRGRHMLLSPMDWALIDGWKTRGIPLHVVLRSMEVVFERHCRAQRKRSINSLSYYADEVDAQFGEWLTSQTGRGAVLTDRTVEPETPESHLPFPRAFILAHLANYRASIRRSFQAVSSTDEMFFETLRIVTAELEKLELDFAQAVAPDCGELESALVAMEELIDQAALTYVSPTDLATWRAEAELQLTAYRSRMQPDVYEQTVENLLHRRVRESIGIPRLSLFSL